MDISFNVEQALDKLDMMSLEEAQEWIAELDKEEVARVAEFILDCVRINSASGADLDFLAPIPTFPEVSGESIEDKQKSLSQVISEAKKVLEDVKEVGKQLNREQCRKSVIIVR